jgi:D-cysteine desulfhydrase family pyridoxal phosphate-dependent enzyme
VSHTLTTVSAPPRLELARTPTPLEPFDRLSEAWGGPRIWVKRDDLTGFGLSGNKVRKLEHHFAAARQDRADTVITTGAAQSNHCRATALAAARLGYDCLLLARTHDGEPPDEATGNHLLQLLAGAEVRYVTPDEYRERDRLMASEAERLARAGRRAWVIPEGASDALGMWGMATCFTEITEQSTALDVDAVALWHAASSAGTTAGLGWMADRLDSSIPLVAVSVGDPVEHLREHVEAIWSQACATWGGEMPEPVLRYTDEYVGGGYGLVEAEQPAVVEQATRLTGLLFDPTYTGKAIYGLWQEIGSGRFEAGTDVIFLHTGGGFAALA